MSDEVEVNYSKELRETILGRVLKYDMYTAASLWAVLNRVPMPMEDGMRIRYEYTEGFTCSMSRGIRIQRPSLRSISSAPDGGVWSWGVL